jgi:hypothetical protein
MDNKPGFFLKVLERLKKGLTPEPKVAKVFSKKEVDFLFKEVDRVIDEMNDKAKTKEFNRITQENANKILEQWGNNVIRIRNCPISGCTQFLRHKGPCDGED